MSLENGEHSFIPKVKRIAGIIRRIPTLYMEYMEALKEEWEQRNEKKQVGRDARLMTLAAKEKLQRASTYDEGLGIVAEYHTSIDNYIMDRYRSKPREFQEALLEVFTKQGEEAQKRYARGGTDRDRLDMEMSARLVIRLRQNLEESDK